MKNKLIKYLAEIDAFADLKENDLTEIDSRGLAHDHIKLGDTGWIVRIPRGNQLDMDDADYLNLQKGIYEAMSASGATPDILGVIQPNADLPHGALIVEYIEGRNIQSEADLEAVAECLGKIHKMPIPEKVEPLDKADHPLAGQEFLLTDVFADAFKSDALSSETRQLLQAERADLLQDIAELKQDKNIPLSLIGGDSHLGNYLIDKQGKAWLVDLEFAAYDLALIDLADASLSITSKLDPYIGVTPSDETVKKFYKTWKKTVGQDFTDKTEKLISLTERVVQLRTLAWLSYWVSEGRDKENNKVSQKSLENWDKMAAHYLEADNLRAVFNTQASKNKPSRIKPLPPSNKP